MKFDTKFSKITSRLGNCLTIVRSYDERPEEPNILITVGEGPDHSHVLLHDEGAEELHAWLTSYLKWRLRKSQ